MKEASGELSMTAVAIIAIAAVGVVFTTLVWPSIKNTIQRQTYCSGAYGCTACEDNKRTCSYVDNKGIEHDDLSCGCDTAT